jgi:hypothetical protein
VNVVVVPVEADHDALARGRGLDHAVDELAAVLESLAAGLVVHAGQHGRLPD